MWRKILTAALLALLLQVLTGCITQFVAKQMVAAPNADGKVAQKAIRGRALFDRHYSVEVGPPRATLRYWVVEPKHVAVAAVTSLRGLPPWPDAAGPAKRMEVRFGPMRSGPARGWYQVMRFTSPLAGVLSLHSQPRGTVLVLSGHSSALRKNPYLLPWVGVFADAGYRVVVLESRGHGDSTGRMITYGVHEREDVRQVIDDLEDRGLLTGPLTAFGHSLGAAVAIQAASVDERIEAVVAVSSFADLRQEMRDFADWKVPYLRWLVNDWVLDAALNQAGHIAGFDPDHASPARAIARTTVPVLLLHGDADRIVPLEHSLQIFHARETGTDLVVFPGATHFSLMKADDFDAMKRVILPWLERNLPEAEEAPIGPLRRAGTTPAAAGS